MTDDIAYIALGSNMGDRHGHLATARGRIAALARVTVLAESQVEETAPVGVTDQPIFLNQMLAVRTALTPRALLDRLHEIETLGGRVRSVRWGPRSIDLDIVRFGDRDVAEADLVIPHAELHNRPFWLRQIAQLAAALATEPVLGARAHERRV